MMERPEENIAGQKFLKTNKRATKSVFRRVMVVLLRTTSYTYVTNTTQVYAGERVTKFHCQKINY